VDTHFDQQREPQCNKEQNEGKPTSLTFNYAAFAGAQIHPFIDIPERKTIFSQFIVTHIYFT